MKNRIYFFCALAAIALLALASCKKDSPQTGVKVESVSFKESSYTIAENDIDFNLKKELVVTPAGLLDTCKTIKWTVDDENVAEMDGSYLIPRMAGEVKVTVTVQGSKSASCNVTITEIPVEGITLNAMTLNVGKSAKIEYTTKPEGLPIQKFTLKSDKESVATIDADGMITAVKEGTAKITATYGEISSSCTVTVNKVAVTSVTLNYTTYKFTAVNQTVQLEATVAPDDASYPAVSWSSSNTTVATVSNSGLVTLKKAGDATITATSDGKSATCKVFMVETGTVKDCQNNTYKTVKIGDQWWMAENLKCIKYDTQSGKSGTVLGAWTINVLDDTWNSSYYTDATLVVNWRSTEYAENLSAAQRSKLGCAYSWSAATGLTFSYVNKSYTKQQGICPNGWHLPTKEEWETLETTIGDDARLINSTSGWYDKANNGTDDYGFTALPAHYSLGANGNGEKGKVQYPGNSARFQTATTTKYGLYWAEINSKYQSETPHIYYDDVHANYDAAFVRCVKN